MAYEPFQPIRYISVDRDGRATTLATTGPTLRLPWSACGNHHAAPSSRTLAQVERDHIVGTLHATNWVLGGWDGAAARLGLSRTTLISRMQRLGISAGSGLGKAAS